ncbi:MAG: hypothetical protein RLY86_418 [Pseudomonadota bacterium]|jgi:ATP-binding cassette subfamily C protein
MWTSLKKLYALLDPRSRRNGALLAGLMLCGALLEVVSVAAVPAFVSAVVYPETLARIPWLDGALRDLGIVGTTDLVIWGAVALVAVFTVKTLFLIGNFQAQLRYTSNRHVDFARRLTRAYMRAPYTFHLGRNTSELLRNIDRESGVIANSVIGAILELATHVTILVAVMGFLFVAEPWITLIWVAVFGIMGTTGVLTLSARLKQYGLEEQEQRKSFVQSLYQGFGAIKEARVLNREKFFADKVSDAVRSIALVFRFKNVVSKSVGPVTELTAITGLLIIAVALVMLDRPTDSILVTLSLFVVGLVRLRQTVGAAMTHLTGLRYSIVSVDPVHADLTALEPDTVDWPAGPPPAPLPLRRGLELRDVWYSHDAAKGPALQGVSLTVPAGAAIGLVGSTGAGKSTLVDIVLGLLTPDRGQVVVDGQDIHAAGHLTAWQRSIGYVPQTIALLDDTIRRNIALGIPDAEIDEAALARAIRTAQLETFIAAQPDGLDAVIGEQGVRVSGGERQRIGIARALYHDPSVLILDEATSALDTRTEKAIIAAVEAAKGERTIIMIAHRLSTVRNCDILYFIKKGRIDGAGSFQDLEDSHDEFRQMVAG